MAASEDADLSLASRVCIDTSRAAAAAAAAAGRVNPVQRQGVRRAGHERLIDTRASSQTDRARWRIFHHFIRLSANARPPIDHFSSVLEGSEKQRSTLQH